jgi:hypothetical protein
MGVNCEFAAGGRLRSRLLVASPIHLTYCERHSGTANSSSPSGRAPATPATIPDRSKRRAVSASAPSASSAGRNLFSDPKDGWIAPRSITAGSADDADGADGIFGLRAHPDHSRSCPAFTREGDLDAQRPQERLRPRQSAGERPRIFRPCDAPPSKSHREHPLHTNAKDLTRSRST